MVVPLLHPQAHGLPFLLTLELHPAVPGGTAPAAPPPPPLQLDRSLYTLHYVLGGAGELVRGSGGGGEPLQAGDAVLTHFGGAACRAAPPGAAAAEEAGAANLLAGSPWQLAELVAYLPRQLFEAEQQAAAAQQQLDAQRAGTQVLHAAGLQPLLLGAAGRSSGGGAAAVQPLPGEFVDALLAGARDTARKALLLHDEEHGGVAAGQASTGSGPAAGGGSPAAGGLLQRAARAAASSLAAWWEAQQQRACPVAKRTLAELTAFRLPNQSNRLAVQFDPFSLPQVRVAHVTCVQPPLFGRECVSLLQEAAGRLPNQSDRRLVPLVRRPAHAPRAALVLICRTRRCCALPTSPTCARLPSPLVASQVPFISGIEVFERGHRTTPHVHPRAHELFFILAGEGVGFCGDQRFPGAPLPACRLAATSRGVGASEPRVALESGAERGGGAAFPCLLAGLCDVVAVVSPWRHHSSRCATCCIPVVSSHSAQMPRSARRRCGCVPSRQRARH